ncbi:MAG: carboxylesterase family protein [Sedimentisphaerales bacterium]|nr:carboxylesterase family protein [Sedimentisphaerales bacterium]
MNARIQAGIFEWWHLALVFAVVLVVVLGLAGYAPAGQNKGRLLAAGATHKGVEYVPGGHARQKLDIYLPSTAGEELLPLIVWIHGGAWQTGSKKDCPAKSFLSKGYAVAGPAESRRKGEIPDS